MPPPNDNFVHAPLVVDHFDEIDSTSLHARRLIENEPESVVSPRLIVAEAQTAGRGQRGRAWSSPRGGLWCTFVAPWRAPACKGELSGESVGTLGVRLGLACLRTIQLAIEYEGRREGTALSGARAKLKLPNDVYIGDRKVLGILTEIVGGGGVAVGKTTRQSDRFLLVGVGINANNELEHLPAEIAGIATTLQNEIGREVDLLALRRTLASNVLTALSALALDEQELDEVASHLYAKGHDVRIMTSEGEVVSGALEGVDRDGRVIVRAGDRVMRGSLA